MNHWESKTIEDNRFDVVLDRSRRTERRCKHSFVKIFQTWTASSSALANIEPSSSSFLGNVIAWIQPLCPNRRALIRFNSICQTTIILSQPAEAYNFKYISGKINLKRCFFLTRSTNKIRKSRKSQCSDITKMTFEKCRFYQSFWPIEAIN